MRHMEGGIDSRWIFDVEAESIHQKKFNKIPWKNKNNIKSYKVLEIEIQSPSVSKSFLIFYYTGATGNWIFERLSIKQTAKEMYLTWVHKVISTCCSCRNMHIHLVQIIDSLGLQS